MYPFQEAPPVWSPGLIWGSSWHHTREQHLLTNHWHLSWPETRAQAASQPNNLEPGPHLSHTAALTGHLESEPRLQVGWLLGWQPLTTGLLRYQKHRMVWPCWVGEQLPTGLTTEECPVTLGVLVLP